MKNSHLILTALITSVATFIAYDPISGALTLFLALGFTSFVLWLESRPRVDAPAIRDINAILAQHQDLLDSQRAQIERLILRGGK